MLNKLKILAIIPARANSKGLPGKNTMQLAGKPLIAWTIDSAVGSKLIDRTVISTDSEQIRQLAKTLGADAPFLRPAELALDDTPAIETVLHACQMLPGYDVLVLLQPTSPLRAASDIDAAIQLLEKKDADFCVSVTKPKHHPNWLFKKSANGFLESYEKFEICTDRQSLSPIYAPNGALYAARLGPLIEQRSMSGPRTIAYEMEEDKSCDIDTLFDFEMCEFILSRDSQ